MRYTNKRKTGMKGRVTAIFLEGGKREMGQGLRTKGDHVVDH